MRVLTTMPDFTLLYTSRRISAVLTVITEWLSNASNPESIEVVLSLDDDYTEGFNMEPEIAAQIAASFPTVLYRCVRAPVPGNCVRGWNAAAEAATGKVLIALSDDFRCFKGWDAELKALRQSGRWLADGRWMDGDYVVHVHDGLHGDLCTLPVVTKKRYDKFGFFYYPAYESMYADTELTYRASNESALIDARYLRFQHDHHSTQRRTEDEVDATHNSKDRYRSGELLFKYRRASGFPIDRGPKADEYIMPPDAGFDRYAVFIQAIRDDFCLEATCARLVEEGLRNFFFVIPTEYWSGEPTPVAHVEEVKEIARRTANLVRGTRCTVSSQPVGWHRHGAANRIEVETRCRNAALERIIASGFRHILVVDGDELWRRGFLSTLHAKVIAEHPTALAVRNVPVVGLPGYPVHDAKDRVLVYLRGDQCFRECRSPHCAATMMEDYGLFHFSGVRRNFDEIVQKMRNSGHYDDPAYRFEEFIEKVLPNIKPGLENVHMYAGYQIWPVIRNFTPEEYADIPDSIRSYLSNQTEPAPSVRGLFRQGNLDSAYA